MHVSAMSCTSYRQCIMSVMTLENILKKKRLCAAITPRVLNWFVLFRYNILLKPIGVVPWKFPPWSPLTIIKTLTAYLCSVFTICKYFKKWHYGLFSGTGSAYSTQTGFMLFHIFGLNDFISITGLKHLVSNTINRTAQFDADATQWFNTSHTRQNVYAPTKQPKSFSNTEANAKTKHMK